MRVVDGTSGVTHKAAPTSSMTGSFMLAPRDTHYPGGKKDSNRLGYVNLSPTHESHDVLLSKSIYNMALKLTCEASCP
jgi:hypothetical protein